MVSAIKDKQNESTTLETHEGSLAAGLVGCVMTVAIIVSQLLVIAVIIKEPRFRTPSNYFIISLSASDLLIAILCGTFWTTFSFLGYWPASAFLCDLWHICDYILCSVSIYTILSISVDRLLFLSYPMRYPAKRTKHKVKLALCGIWVGMAIIFTPLIGVTQHVYGRDRREHECTTFYVKSVPITIVTMLFTVWIPIILTTLVYVRIFYIAKSVCRHQPVLITMQCMSNNSCPNGSKENGGNNTSSLSKEVHSVSASISPRSRRVASSVTSTDRLTHRPSTRKHYIKDKKALVTIAMLLGVFTICWLPISIILVALATRKGMVDHTWVMIGYWCGYASSLLNPLCYLVGNTDFRRTMVDIIYRRSSRRL